MPQIHSKPMVNVIKRLARAIFRDYSFYQIYRHECTGEIPAHTRSFGLSR